MRRQQPSLAVAYFYFDVNDATKMTVQGLLCSMVLGLTASLGKWSYLDQVYDKCQKGCQMPGKADLMEALRGLLNEFPQVYVVMDALDECLEFEKLYASIQTIIGWQTPGCHLLVTSRTEKYAVNEVQAVIEINLSSDVVMYDIASYVSKVMESSRLKNLRKDVQEKVKYELLHGSNGM